jgi:hypothetical protein
MANTKLGLAVVLLLGLFAIGAQGQDGLTAILSDPDLAPAVSYILGDPPLQAELLDSSLVQTLIADPPTATTFLASPTFQEILNDKDTLSELVNSPELSAVLSADAPTALPIFVEALQTPATGNAENDLQTLEAAFAPLLQPTTAGARKLLRA